MFDLLLRRATLADGSCRDVGIHQGRIAALVPHDSFSELERHAEQTLDLEHHLLCPGFIDGHIHLDKTFMGADWIPHVPGESVRERIQVEKRIRSQIQVPVTQRAAYLTELAVSRGSTILRTHVDIDPEVGLQHFYSLLDIRKQYQEIVDLQIVAFPQSGVLNAPGTLELLERALKEGADLIGGLDPAGIDGDISGQLDAIFRLAERYGVPIDIHLHDPDHLGIFELEQIIQRTLALGLQRKVTVSHAYCLGMVPVATASRMAEKLAEAGIAIMTNAPGHCAFPSILQLHAAGVTVFSGSDDIRNAWWPFGDADMLERVMLVAYRSNFRTDADLTLAFTLATEGAAQALQVPNYGLKVGGIADLVVLEGRHIPEVVVSRPQRRYVIKKGTVIAQKGCLLPRFSFVSGMWAESPERLRLPLPNGT